jgi:hypothetical protein
VRHAHTLFRLRFVTRNGGTACGLTLTHAHSNASPDDVLLPGTTGSPGSPGDLQAIVDGPVVARPAEGVGASQEARAGAAVDEQLYRQGGSGGGGQGVRGARHEGLTRVARERRGRRILRSLLNTMRRMLSAPAHEDKNTLLTRLCAVLARPGAPEGGTELHVQSWLLERSPPDAVVALE